jgi:ATP-dependent helicase/nuclease subunit A
LRKREPSPTQAKRLGASDEDRLLQLHRELGDRIDIAANALAEQAAYRFNLAGLTCAVALLEHYDQLKQSRQLIDFTDVEWQANRLLTNSEQAEYMQYKLDARYRHILLDEFQDTNPLQWQTLRAWLEASAAADRRPSVFMVGDPKQSIYRFRRADARLFDIAATFLQDEFGAARLSQHVTRRNAPAVLAVVNAVFGAEPEFLHFEPHAAYHADLPGTVEVLLLPSGETNEPEANDAEPGFRNPLLEPLSLEPDRRREEEAHLLAERIGEMVGSWQVADDKGNTHPATYRDIMVLTRSRTHLAVYEEALKAAHIPFVSSRQGGLLDTLEASDVIALLQFLTAPFIDLNLAQVLRSPLFSCSDEDLMSLAQIETTTISPSPLRGEGWGEGKIDEEPSTRNPKLSWWQRLSNTATNTSTSNALTRAHSLLARWMAMTDRLPVHDLLDRIYFEADVESRYQAAVPDAMRVGVSANLRAFMELALAMDSGRYPSLPRFLDELGALRRTATQEAPDEGATGDGGNAVCIYTVHGSKGLEAPIVWLLGADGGEGRTDHYGVLLDWPTEAHVPQHFSLYGKKDERGKARSIYFDEEAALDRRENLNLLYVAMTRARQALIVSGSGSKRAGDTWYDKIARALEQSKEAGSKEIEKVRQEEISTPFGLSLSKPIHLSESLLRQTQHERTPLHPSSLNAPLPTGERISTKLSEARRYGIQLHAVLEYVAPPHCQTDKLLLQRLLGIPETDFESLWRDAQQLVNADHLRHFFDPTQYVTAYSEVSFCGEDGAVRRLDRLVELGDSVWVLDYKTREVADEKELTRAVAPYRKQMAEYRAAMEKVYPDKPVYCALIFKGGQLFRL